MALGFGRKKPADDISASSDTAAAPVAAHAPSSPQNSEVDAFDLDAFAASPAPVAAASQSSGDSLDSAFDFPQTEAFQVTPADTSEADTLDFDKLYEIEQANAAHIANQNSAPAPLVPPSARLQEPAVPFYEPQVPVTTEVAPKKKSPLLPLLGALAILGLGGAASYLLSQRAPETEEVAPAPASRLPRRAAPPVQSAPPVSAPPVLAPRAAAVVKSPPLIAPGTAVSPGIAPASDKRSQLRAIWKRGAAAKKRGDFAGARRFWNQGLKIQPDNIGFQESIAKLPK